MLPLEIALFTTGGTIDGADSERNALRSESAAHQWLSAQPDVVVRATTVFNKDSREITSSDRQHLVHDIISRDAKNVIVTHGTFTIVDTARALKARLSSDDRTILCVGSWIPFGESGSDAPAQMKFALEKLRQRVPGVWISMDGQLWDPDTTEKREISPGRWAFATIAA